MVSFNRKYLFAIINMIVICVLYNFIPPSSLVFIAMIPALFFGIWTKKFFLIVFSLMLLFIVIGLFVFLMVFPNLGVLTENVNFIVYIYSQIFPYEMNYSILSLMDIKVLLWVGVIIFFILIGSVFMKRNEFDVMVTFSYFIMLFTAFFLVFNVFFYLIPSIRVLILLNPILRYILFFFYAILPILVFTLFILMIECLFSKSERSKYARNISKMDKQVGKSRNLKFIFTGLSYLLIIVVIIVVIVYLVLI